MSTRTDPWRYIKPQQGEIAFLEAVDQVKDLLTNQDREILSHHKVEGVDTRGRIILRQSPQLSKTLNGRSKAINLISHALARNDWATGISLKYSEPPAFPSSPFKHLYLPPAFVNMTLPHSKPLPRHNEFSRKNGNLSLSILSRRNIGLPYGAIARLVLLYLTTKRVTNKERHFNLGESWRDFIRTMGVSWNARNFRAVQDQLERLCSSSFSVLSRNKDAKNFKGMFITDQWSRNSQGVHVSLSEKFFLLSGESVVPLETKIIQQLRRSALALDLYCWLTHRTANVKHPTLIKWKDLELQFGSDYKRHRDFCSKFRKTFILVLQQKPVAPVVDLLPEGLSLKPGSAADIDWLERMQRIALKRSL